MGRISATAAEVASGEIRPNFVFLLVDDWGWTDAGCFGSDLYETPNIDRLAELGTRFTNCTVHAPIVDGEEKPELIDRFTFWEFNKSVRYSHLHTSLSNNVITDLKRRGIVLSEQFIAMLASHHSLAGPQF